MIINILYGKIYIHNTVVDFITIYEDLANGYFKTANVRQRSADLQKVLKKSLKAQGPPLDNVDCWKKVNYNNT